MKSSYNTIILKMRWLSYQKRLMSMEIAYLRNKVAHLENNKSTRTSYTYAKQKHHATPIRKEYDARMGLKKFKEILLMDVNG